MCLNKKSNICTIVILVFFLLKCIYSQSEILRDENSIAGIHGGLGFSENSNSFDFGGCAANGRVDMCILGANVTAKNEDKEEVEVDVTGLLFGVHFFNRRKNMPLSFSIDMVVLNAPAGFFGPRLYFYALSKENGFVIPSFSINLAPSLISESFVYSLNCEMGGIKNKKLYFWVTPGISFVEKYFTFGISASMMFNVQFARGFPF